MVNFLEKLSDNFPNFTKKRSLTLNLQNEHIQFLNRLAHEDDFNLSINSALFGS